MVSFAIRVVLYSPVTYVIHFAMPTIEERATWYPYFGRAGGERGRKYIAPCHVEQHAGDVLFVPSLWTHQVVNLAESVGFATEVHY